MKKRPTTDNRGAADERACIKRKAKALQREWDQSAGFQALHDIIDFIDSRSKRFKARKRGL